MFSRYNGVFYNVEMMLFSSFEEVGEIVCAEMDSVDRIAFSIDAIYTFGET